MSSPVQPHLAPYPLSDWMGHSLVTPCSSVSSAPRHLDSSFCSEFSPLPPSPLPTDTHTHTPRSLDEMLQHTQDLPLPLKLQQLKQWQQHMQEQLKAHQKDQQRLLGMELTDYPDSSVLSGRGYPESPVLSGRGPVLSGGGPVLSGRGSTAASSSETETPTRCSQEPWTLDTYPRSSSSNSTTAQQDSQSPEPTQEASTQDRPIRPGVGRRAHTFEELLEEELKMEQERQKGKNPVGDQTAGPKRSFLRKGEGLLRFNRTSLKPTAQNLAEPLAKHPESRESLTGQREPQRNKPRPARSRPSEPSARGHSQNLHQNQPAAARGHSQNLHQNRPAAARPGGTKPRPASAAARTLQRKTASLASHTHTLASHTPTMASHTHTLPSHTPTLDSHTHSQSLCSAPVAMETSFEVWQRERQREWAELGEFELLEVAAEELSFTSCSSSILQALGTHTHTNTRRLSSTPIKAHHTVKTHATDHHTVKTHTTDHNTVKTHTTDHNTVKTHATDHHTVKTHATDHHTVKTHTTDHNTVKTHTTDSLAIVGHTRTAHTPSRATHTSAVELPLSLCAEEDEGPGGHEHMRDEEEEEDGEEDDEEVTRVAPNSHCLPVTTPPYDRCTYQEPEGAGHGEGSAALSDGVEVEFDDDDTWADISQDALQPERTLRRKVAGATGVEWVSSEPDDEEREAHTHSPTHTHPSLLVAKLFPALQPKPRPTHVTQTSTQPIRNQESEGVCEVMRERLVQLELEIERFRMETAELTRQKTSLATHQQELRKEKAEFEAKRSQTEAEWAEFKQAEMRKLQRDRKLFEKHSAAARSTHTSAQREEMQVLQQQLCDLREECVRKEQRWKSTHTRLQQQIHTLTTHNQELRLQIHTLENLRLTGWRTRREERRAGDERGAQRRKTKEKGDEKGPGVPHSPKNNTRSSDDSGPEGNTLNSGSPTSDGDVTRIGRVSDDVTHAELHAAPGVQLASQKEGEITHPDGKIERVFKDGSRLLVFPNGTQKLLSTDGSAKVTFFNGDIKEVCPDHRVVYFFADAQTTHITFPDGTELLQFPNDQTEKLYPDGRKEIVFPDQTLKTLYPDGREESVLPDGTIIRLNTQRGVREVVFVSGEREEHTAEWRRRVYADGTVKTVYSDGTQETHYASGRLRIKDPQGRVVTDTHTP
ncbi:uncharacterized protein cpap [Alosa pseudoharengus]|uniref:uncharacterized protein cpap n=1 Tax=Alosa pseudoharengus TaxID=34774 RepID=UPI003F8C1125